jgi:hypothetical protein
VLRPAAARPVQHSTPNGSDNSEKHSTPNDISEKSGR